MCAVPALKGTRVSEAETTKQLLWHITDHMVKCHLLSKAFTLSFCLYMTPKWTVQRLLVRNQIIWPSFLCVFLKISDISEKRNFISPLISLSIFWCLIVQTRIMCFSLCSCLCVDKEDATGKDLFTIMVKWCSHCPTEGN